MNKFNYVYNRLIARENLHHARNTYSITLSQTEFVDELS